MTSREQDAISTAVAEGYRFDGPALELGAPDLMKSPVAREMMRTAAREIARGGFGIGRRR